MATVSSSFPQLVVKAVSITPYLICFLGETLAICRVWCPDALLSPRFQVQLIEHRYGFAVQSTLGWPTCLSHGDESRL